MDGVFGLTQVIKHYYSNNENDIKISKNEYKYVRKISM